MRISEYFGLNRSQPYLDFVDVPTNTDLAVFLTPSAIKSLQSSWAHECKSLIQHYFELVLRHVKDGNHEQAQSLLNCLNEQNEYHLGFSSGKSQGRAFGRESAGSVWNALAYSQASKSGLLADLEDTCLFIQGIGVDMISDALCNILRGPLIRYTQDMCIYYGIQTTPDMASGPIWNSTTETWDQSFVNLPDGPTGALIFVPKIFVRHRLCYQHEEYYRHYLLPEMQKDEIASGSSLVTMLADGTPRVTKTALMEKYGADKIASTDQTIPRTKILAEYKDAKNKSPPPPLAHEQFAEIEETSPPDWDSLLDELHAIPPGRDGATAYEDVIEKALSSLFYPALCRPEKQYDIHDRRKRIDITYSNESRSGFFYWLSLHYPCALVFVECKNYGKEIGNPELDQLAGRFPPSRGRVGLMVCRSLEDEALFEKRCIDTAKDDRGWIISLTDSDLTDMILTAKEDMDGRTSFRILREKFERLLK